MRTRKRKTRRERVRRIQLMIIISEELLRREEKTERDLTSIKCLTMITRRMSCL